MVFPGRSELGCSHVMRDRTMPAELVDLNRIPLNLARSREFPGGAEHARWVFDYNPGEDDDDEAGYKFAAHAFLPGEYVSISGQDGKLHTFRVVSVDPVVLSMALIESFELEVTV
jgi:hypothetical protein